MSVARGSAPLDVIADAIPKGAAFGDLQRAEMANGILQALAEHGYTVVRANDAAALVRVGALYLDALDADPEHEMLTLTEAFAVTEVREAVDRCRGATDQ